MRSAGRDAAAPLGGMVLFLPLVLLIVYMFYSQQRRQKKWQGLLIRNMNWSWR